jgi:hypothetical protein
MPGQFKLLGEDLIILGGLGRQLPRRLPDGLGRERKSLVRHLTVARRQFVALHFHGHRGRPGDGSFNRRGRRPIARPHLPHFVQETLTQRLAVLGQRCAERLAADRATDATPHMALVDLYPAATSGTEHTNQVSGSRAPLAPRSG